MTNLEKLIEVFGCKVERHYDDGCYLIDIDDETVFKAEWADAEYEEPSYSAKVMKKFMNSIYGYNSRLEDIEDRCDEYFARIDAIKDCHGYDIDIIKDKIHNMSVILNDLAESDKMQSTTNYAVNDYIETLRQSFENKLKEVEKRFNERIERECRSVKFNSDAEYALMVNRHDILDRKVNRIENDLREEISQIKKG